MSGAEKLAQIGFECLKVWTIFTDEKETDRKYIFGTVNNTQQHHKSHKIFFFFLKTQSAMHAELQLQHLWAKQQYLPAWGALPSGNILLTLSQGHLTNYRISSRNAKGLPCLLGYCLVEKLPHYPFPRQALHYQVLLTLGAYPSLCNVLSVVIILSAFQIHT